MRTVAAIIVLASSPAIADDGARRLHAHEAAGADAQHGPLLHLDALPPLQSEGVGAARQRTTLVLDLGHAELSAIGEAWQAGQAPVALDPDNRDEIARGWRAGSELSYDLGPVRLGVTAAWGHVESRYEHGTYRVIGISASRAVRLSRWMTGWISLGIAHQAWADTPPPGEADSTTVGLTVGTTFR